MSSAGVLCVIVHHRGRELLGRCLESILASHGVDLEVVVVSNACVEPLPEIVSASERVHVVESARSLGFSAANALGVSWARRSLPRCDHYLFLNNDTVAWPDALERLTACLAGRPDLAVVGPRLMILGAPGLVNSLGLNVTAVGEAWDEGIGRSLAEYEPLPSTRDVLAVTGAALLVRRDAYEALGGWQNLYGFYYEDIDLCLRARSRGHGVAVVCDAVVEHAISATAARGSSLKVQLSWRNRFLLLLVHWPAGLLAGVGPRLVWRESRLLLRRLRHRAWDDARLQVRAWGGVLKRLPAALALRRSGGARTGWVEVLAPPGSVPAITLPPLEDEAAAEAG